MMKVDCHCHTKASWDCTTDLHRFIDDGAAAGIDAAIVCDHNSLSGVEKLLEMNPPFRVIPAMEVNTREGELLAYFVEKPLPTQRSVEETVDLIHQQGGLAVIPHPFAMTALHRLKEPFLSNAASIVDALEGLNARNENPLADHRSRELAARFGKPITAGSDAHLPGKLGTAFIEIEDFTGATDFLAKLATARPVLIKRTGIVTNILGFAHALVQKYTSKLLNNSSHHSLVD